MNTHASTPTHHTSFIHTHSYTIRQRNIHRLQQLEHQPKKCECSCKRTSKINGVKFRQQMKRYEIRVTQRCACLSFTFRGQEKIVASKKWLKQNNDDDDDDGSEKISKVISWRTGLRWIRYWKFFDDSIRIICCCFFRFFLSFSNWGWKLGVFSI